MNYFVERNYIKSIEEAKKFSFDGKCPNCSSTMTEFTSEDKSIFLCKDCGCIYLPENIKNIKPSSYKYKKRIGLFVPVFEKPTPNQRTYLTEFAQYTNTHIDLDSITKEEASYLINNFKHKFGNIPNVLDEMASALEAQVLQCEIYDSIKEHIDNTKDGNNDEQ